MVGGKRQNLSGGYVKKLKQSSQASLREEVHICPLQVQFDKLS